MQQSSPKGQRRFHFLVIELAPASCSDNPPCPRHTLRLSCIAAVAQAGNQLGTGEGSSSQGDGVRFLFDGLDEILNGIDFCRLEIGFATLRAHPCRNAVQGQVTALPVNMERCFSLFHFSFAVQAFHGALLVLKSLLHSFSPGM